LLFSQVRIWLDDLGFDWFLAVCFSIHLFGRRVLSILQLGALNGRSGCFRWIVGRAGVKKNSLSEDLFTNGLVFDRGGVNGDGFEGTIGANSENWGAGLTAFRVEVVADACWIGGLDKPLVRHG